jgi:hypothetical protein
MFVLASLGFLFASVAVFNCWSLVVSANLQEYAHRFWQMRFWLVDGANELLFLVCTAALVLISMVEQKYGSVVERNDTEEELADLHC